MTDQEWAAEAVRRMLLRALAGLVAEWARMAEALKR